MHYCPASPLTVPDDSMVLVVEWFVISWYRVICWRGIWGNLSGSRWIRANAEYLSNMNILHNSFSLTISTQPHTTAHNREVL
jgi:hypothetical protein